VSKHSACQIIFSLSFALENCIFYIPFNSLFFRVMRPSPFDHPKSNLLGRFELLFHRVV
jgi:hypothetical protein